MKELSDKELQDILNENNEVITAENVIWCDVTRC